MSIEIQCMTEKLIVITIKLDYSKVPCPPMSVVIGIKFYIDTLFLQLKWLNLRRQTDNGRRSNGERLYEDSS